jgi:hypothetical protein
MGVGVEERREKAAELRGARSGDEQRRPDLLRRRLNRLFDLET